MPIQVPNLSPPLVLEFSPGGYNRRRYPTYATSVHADASYGSLCCYKLHRAFSHRHARHAIDTDYSKTGAMTHTKRNRTPGRPGRWDDDDAALGVVSL